MAATISKGTLNLRFMKNAQRAEEEIEADSVKTVIKDESQWEVAREVKDLLGITSEPSTSSLVTHEASYLPFVLSRSDASGSPVKLRGRRTWGKRGQEVTGMELPPDDESRGSSSARQDPAEHHAASKRLTSISSFGPGSSLTAKRAKSKSRIAKSARELIREGPSLSGPSSPPAPQSGTTSEIKKTKTEHAPTSIRPAPSPPDENNKIAGAPPPSPPHPPKFLKPAGVDDPSDYVPRDGSRRAQQQREGTDDRTHGTLRPNLKRERDDRHEAGPPAADKKRKKSGAARRRSPE